MPDRSATVAAPKTPARLHLEVQGVVQGVGFRPFVHRLAASHHLSGFVCNHSAGVTIEVEGNPENLAEFRQELVSQAPPLARIERVTTATVACLASTHFEIVGSHALAHEQTLVAADSAICDDCLTELLDPANRRYHYPFINCTNCGPRYTIIRGLPYDRPQTTMAGFALCPQCQAEYDDPRDRRFHAQPNACPVCGPQIEFRWLCERVPSFVQCQEISALSPLSQDAALTTTRRLLACGGIAGIKGIGGFHLACDATNQRAVAELRRRKARGDKPFAIMARDLPSVLRIASVSAAEIALLTSPARPIVLLKKRPDSPLSSQVAPGNSTVGVMLPYTPLHHLLFAPSENPDDIEPAPWLVMTSANRAGEPIVASNEEAIAQLGDLCDGLLMHNRDIHIACDDSVCRVIAGVPQLLRRARGYAPLPMPLPVAVMPTLAVGGEIKNAFCVADQQHAFMGQHIGDLESWETQQCFGRTVDHLQKLFAIEPQVIACDLHPAYHSTHLAAQLARSRSETRLVQVQHHHAHLASLMAEHALGPDQPIIGFCFDGTGYGTDGTIWGGEVMVTTYTAFQRVAHLAYFPLPGGDAAIHKPYRAALAALWSAAIAWDEALAPVAEAPASERALLRRQLETGLTCVATSSMGRLFDIVAALCGVCQVASYEAQAAIELEALAADEPTAYTFTLSDGPPISVGSQPVLQAIVDDLLKHTPVPRIASRFHNAVANLIVELSLQIRQRTAINQVGLSGGVFQNATLLQRTLDRLHQANFEPLIHRQVPPNDGGLALGQIMVAAAQINKRKGT